MSKYGAVRAVGASGRVYASKMERDYADELRLLELAGHVRNIVEQPVVPLVAGIKMIPDFRFEELTAGFSSIATFPRIWVDVKGCETDMFRLKCRLWAKFGPGPLRIVKRVKAGGFAVVKTIEVVP